MRRANTPPVTCRRPFFPRRRGDGRRDRGPADATRRGIRAAAPSRASGPTDPRARVPHGPGRCPETSSPPSPSPRRRRQQSLGGSSRPVPRMGERRAGGAAAKAAAEWAWGRGHAKTARHKGFWVDLRRSGMGRFVWTGWTCRGSGRACGRGGLLPGKGQRRGGGGGGHEGDTMFNRFCAKVLCTVCLDV